MHEALGVTGFELVRLLKRVGHRVTRPSCLCRDSTADEHNERFWINPPPEKTTPQEALGATFSGHPIPELPTDSSYPDAIASEPNRDRTALTPRPSLIEAH